jgi:hypothetical protein
MQIIPKPTLAIIQEPTNRQPHPQSNDLIQQWVTPQVITALFVGLIIGYWSHLLTSRRETLNRIQAAKDVFGDFILDKKASLPERGILDFYDKTKPEMRTAVQRIGRYLGEDGRGRLDKLWTKYDKTARENLDAHQEGFKGESARSLDTLAGLQAQPPPREIVEHFLDEFYKFAE